MSQFKKEDVFEKITKEDDTPRKVCATVENALRDHFDIPAGMYFHNPCFSEGVSPFDSLLLNRGICIDWYDKTFMASYSNYYFQYDSAVHAVYNGDAECETVVWNSEETLRTTTGIVRKSEEYSNSYKHIEGLARAYRTTDSRSGFGLSAKDWKRTKWLDFLAKHQYSLEEICDTAHKRILFLGFRSHFHFTPRLLEIVTLLKKNETSKGIAAKFKTSPGTVRNQIRSISLMLDCNDIHQLRWKIRGLNI